VLVIAFFYTQQLNLLMLGMCAALIAMLILFNRSGVQHLLLYLVVGLLLWCAMLNSGIHATIAGVVLAFCIPMPFIKKLEHQLHWPVTCLIIPVFALANAGIPIPFAAIGSQLLNPISLGIVSGLVFGKLIGITGATWLAVKTKMAELPTHIKMQHIVGVSLLGGIGFTMSIFIAELGFASYPQELLMAKTGILFASLIAAISGVSWLWFCATPTHE
jgi:NhaA family Na+:H+ antiporter